jgi:hypothetical protein
MAGLKLNLGDIELKNFDPVPAGTYTCTVTAGEMKKTSGEGKLGVVPMINWEFTIVEPEEFAKRKLWTNTVIHETTLFNLKALLLATGEYTDEDLATEIDFEIEDVIGKELDLVAGQREYPKDSGEWRNEVKRFVVPESGAAAPAGKAKGATKKSLLP